MNTRTTTGKSSIRHSSLVAALAACVAVQNAGATDGRYREYVVGERAGGMGGAAIAIATDVDSILYNPAGLANSHGDSISLSANLYGMERYKSKGGLDWGGDEKSSSFVSIPAAMGGVMRFSDELVGGFGVFTPKQEKRHMIAAAPDRSGFDHFDYNDQTVWAGPSIAWAPAGSRFSFGAGVFAVHRDYSISESSFLKGAKSMNGAMDLTALGVLASLGTQVDLGDGWRAGATVQTPTARVWDDGTLSINESSNKGDAYGIYTTDVRVDNYIPWQLAAGISKSGENWSVALDTIWHPSTHYDLARWNIFGEDLALPMKLRSVLDTSIGGEYVVADRYPVRAGFYTAMSAVRIPDDPDSASFTTSDVDMYGVTFSVGRRSDKMSVNLGLDVAFGSGHDLNSNDAAAQSRVSSDRNVVLATVSTTYYF